MDSDNSGRKSSRRWFFGLSTFVILERKYLEMLIFFILENDAKNQIDEGYGCCDYCLIGISYLIGILLLPIFVFLSIKVGFYFSKFHALPRTQISMRSNL